MHVSALSHVLYSSPVEDLLARCCFLYLPDRALKYKHGWVFLAPAPGRGEFNLQAKAAVALGFLLAEKFFSSTASLLLLRGLRRRRKLLLYDPDDDGFKLDLRQVRLAVLCLQLDGEQFRGQALHAFRQWLARLFDREPVADVLRQLGIPGAHIGGHFVDEVRDAGTSVGGGLALKVAHGSGAGQGAGEDHDNNGEALHKTLRILALNHFNQYNIFLS